MNREYPNNMSVPGWAKTNLVVNTKFLPWFMTEAETRVLEIYISIVT